MWLDWSETLNQLLRRGVVSGEKARRFTLDGNYLHSLWRRGKLQEGAHWRFAEPVHGVQMDSETGGLRAATYRPQQFDADAIEALFRSGFEDDPDLWVEFAQATPGVYQFDVSPEADRAALAVGCRASGYDRQLHRKYYTAPDPATAQEALDAVSRYARCGLA